MIDLTLFAVFSESGSSLTIKLSNPNVLEFVFTPENIAEAVEAESGVW